MGEEEEAAEDARVAEGGAVASSDGPLHRPSSSPPSYERSRAELSPELLLVVEPL